MRDDEGATSATLGRILNDQNGVEFAFKQIEAAGCQLVYTFDGFPPEHISNPQFWQTLAQALGVPEASLGVGPTADNWTAPPTVAAAC